jgi:hypothetical protein
MNYVICVNNKQYLRFQGEEIRDEVIRDLVVGQVYKVAPPDVNDGPDDLRIIDESGEDYLFPAHYFTPLHVTEEILTEGSAAVTVRLSPALKGILHAEALAARKSVSALLREWIDERLDLPVAA